MTIIRWTTSIQIVRLFREAGAVEVHLRIESPPITGACYYGVDTPTKEELISYRLKVGEIRKEVGADSLAFLSLERLWELLGDEAWTFCDACFSGAYPVPPRDLPKCKEESLRDASEGKVEAPVEETNSVVELELLSSIVASTWLTFSGKVWSSYGGVQREGVRGQDGDHF